MPKACSCRAFALRPQDAGRAFCRECGSPLWSVSAHAPFIPVKLGALDDSSDIKPGLHLYEAFAAPWHLMHEGLPTFRKMPPSSPPGAELTLVC